ncbi:apses transcription factor-like protein [Mytilinidion resinicola]|uniref:Transcription factor SWI6 n=1 Tax=Mytilinidion resinicola TaxID=574789 RepID=A0A6A6Z8U6_9PEZI|nr:apses transcription factor-like protein [Mytilinidion resinicola]KAF2817542.1 apses transcription factor-like protein [Mytilinidion resinicola]
MYSNSPHQMMVQPSPFRSFGDSNGYTHPMEKPQIYTAVYSGVSVYEMEINRVAVMRRRSDSWLNATQILKVAGVDKGKRTKVLEKEILTGEHEKVQGGYGKYQGTWINYRRGREFCRQYGVEDILRPLLDYDMSADGSAGQGIDTPTKEQAMAANRKRFYTASMDGRNSSQNVGGTFFSNISSTATSALAAMNKVARMNSPAPRPSSSSQRRSMGRPSQGPVGSQESFRGSQQSAPSLNSERSFGANGTGDSAYATQRYSGDYDGPADSQEPPRKRMRPSQEDSFAQPNGAEISMREGSPTEPNDSFVYHQPGQHLATANGEVPTALAPLPPPSDERSELKQAMLTDLFADQSRTDFSNHPAIKELSGSDLDMPIDNTANTALHWAATLARVSLMRLLVSKGANMFRGNAAGQTPLMSAVLVNNSLDHNSFPETLEILAPLIELRDAQGRTILHHIAVTCAIKGRAASSKYYLEALLEYLVRSNTGSNSQSNSFDGSGNLTMKPIGLMRFMQEMVNARDKGGNTALNLVARIGNRSIISQLMEVQADPTIPNYKGMRPIDFGVGSELERADAPSMSQMSSPSKSKAPLSKVEETSREMLPLFQSFLSQASTQYNQESRLKQDAIDRLNESIAQQSALQKSESLHLDTLRQNLRARTDRSQRILNLRRWLDTQRRVLSVTDPSGLQGANKVRVGDADEHGVGVSIRLEDLPETAKNASRSLNLPPSSSAEFLKIPPLPLDASTMSPEQQIYLSRLPSTAVLRSKLEAYVENNIALAGRSKVLRKTNGELGTMYRKVVSLCAGVAVADVDAKLTSLIAAIESEESDTIDLARVKEFLRKVEGVEG